MGYRIFWTVGTNMDSVGAGASVTDHTITIPQPQSSSLTYSFTIVALSTHLPSTVVGPAPVTVGKQKMPFVLLSLFISYIPFKQTHLQLPLMSYLE